MNCPKCGDKVDMNAGHVCLTGNDRLKERITYLQSRIEELETTLQEIHQHYDDTHAEEVNELNARIAELEKKSMHCPRCGDPITNELGDNPICGACALASELAVMTLRARIAELEAENAIFRAADYEALRAEKPVYCAKCRDGIVADDDGICGVCAGAQDGVIENLQNKVAGLEKQAVVWHRFDIDDCNTYPECGMYLTLSIPEITEYREVDDESIYDVLWFELYSEEYWDKHNVTHWTRLPEPPEEEK